MLDPGSRRNRKKASEKAVTKQHMILKNESRMCTCYESKGKEEVTLSDTFQGGKGWLHGRSQSLTLCSLAKRELGLGERWWGFYISRHFAVVVQSPSCVRLSATPWTAACQVSLSFTISLSLLRLVPIESVMPSSHLILCHPLLFLPSIFPSIRVFSSESPLHIRWPEFWSFSLSISPSSDIS